MALEAAERVLKKYFIAAFLLLPFSNLYPFRLYLSLATLVTLSRDRSTHRKVLLCQAFLLFNLLKTLYLSVVLPPDRLDHLRLADYMYIVTGETFTYQIWFPLQAMSLYFTYLLFTVKPVFLRFLGSLLFSPGQPLLGGIGEQKSKSPLRNVQQSALFTRNAIGLLLIICGKRVKGC